MRTGAAGQPNANKFPAVLALLSYNVGQSAWNDLDVQAFSRMKGFVVEWDSVLTPYDILTSPITNGRSRRTWGRWSTAVVLTGARVCRPTD